VRRLGWTELERRSGGVADRNSRTGTTVGRNLYRGGRKWRKGARILLSGRSGSRGKSAVRQVVEGEYFYPVRGDLVL